MTLRRFAKAITPPFIARALRGRPWTWFEGDYATWKEAIAACSGYESMAIAEQVAKAARLVKAGDAAFERDSVAFTSNELNYPLLAALLLAACASQNRLDVVDFGGSLGSTYYQSRRYLSCVARMHWTVVEQPAFVRIGEDEFCDEVLRFTETLEEALARGPANVLLLSSVLQYLPRPHEFLDQLMRHPPAFVILDRMPLVSSGRDRLMVQRVPPSIYRASYPAWFLDRNTLLDHFKENYSLIDEFDSFEAWDMPWGHLRSRGYVFQRHS